jgi:hypothetical protein
LVLVLGAAGAPGASAGSVEVYLTAEEAPRVLFPEGTDVEKRRVRVDAALRARIEKRVLPTKPSLWEGSIATYVIAAGEKVIGYAVVVNEIGKHRPITFVVGVTPEGKVRGVEIMVYREPKGGEVRMKRFLRQYLGKTLEEPILTGRDITNITGATLSVRAVNRGTKKALALVEVVYGVPALVATGAIPSIP